MKQHPTSVHSDLRVFIAATVLLVCMLSACTSHKESQQFTDADHWVQAASRSTLNDPPELSVASQASAWTRIELPHVIRGVIAKAAVNNAQATTSTHWYRFRILRDVVARDLSIYVPRARWPRLQGRLDVYVNGVPLDSSDIVWNSPILLTSPNNLMRAASNADVEVMIALTVQDGQSAALSRVWLGSRDELRTRYAWRQFLQQRFPQVTGISFVILGAFALAFWLVRRTESAYLLFGLLSLVNFVRTLHYYFIDPAALNDWFWWLTINSLAWMMLLAHLFAFRLHEQAFPRTERALAIAVSVISLLSLTAVWFGVSIELWGPMTYLVQIVVGLIVPTLSTIGAWRHGSRSALLLAGVLWLNVALGVHDFLLQNWRISPESVILLPYGAMAMLGVFLLNIARRYLGAIQGVEQLNASLEQRLAERSDELEESHRRLRSIEQEQAVTDERQRLMREMHDGLGSSLMSSLVMVEQGKLDNRQVAIVLREAIDDLKLTIDSLEPMGDDLLTLLGTLRYRLGKRLEAAGIKLEWQVQETPALLWLNPTASLQILRILQESLTNTLKHASATLIRVETHADRSSVAISLTDNGCGFDVAAQLATPIGRGLQNLRRRAALLHGRVEIVSQSGSTTLTLYLPITDSN
jgi:signal transduction histidine kinase